MKFNVIPWIIQTNISVLVYWRLMFGPNSVAASRKMKILILIFHRTKTWIIISKTFKFLRTKVSLKYLHRALFGINININFLVNFDFITKWINEKGEIKGFKSEGEKKIAIDDYLQGVLTGWIFLTSVSIGHHSW